MTTHRPDDPGSGGHRPRSRRTSAGHPEDVKAAAVLESCGRKILTGSVRVLDVTTSFVLADPTVDVDAVQNSILEIFGRLFSAADFVLLNTQRLLT